MSPFLSCAARINVHFVTSIYHCKQLLHRSSLFLRGQRRGVSRWGQCWEMARFEPMSGEEKDDQAGETGGAVPFLGADEGELRQVKCPEGEAGLNDFWQFHCRHRRVQPSLNSGCYWVNQRRRRKLHRHLNSHHHRPPSCRHHRHFFPLQRRQPGSNPFHSHCAASVRFLPTCRHDHNTVSMRPGPHPDWRCTFSSLGTPPPIHGLPPSLLP